MNDQRFPGAMLTDWKAIAEYFSRDPRTVQRWEKEEGLPIHRHPHHKRHSVYAFRDELDRWWQGRTDPVWPEISGGQPTPSGPSQPDSSSRHWRRDLLVVGAVVTAVIVVIVFSAVVVWRAGAF